jgi:N-acetylglutamate synthase-like GNAT family acetyltransferase
VTPEPLADITIRKALIRDVPGMAQLINGFAAQAIMLPRSFYQFYQHLRRAGWTDR